MTTTEARVLCYVATHPASTVTAVADGVGTDYHYASRCLKVLAEAGHVSTVPAEGGKGRPLLTYSATEVGRGAADAARRAHVAAWLP